MGRRRLRRQRQPGSDQNGYCTHVLFTWNLNDRWTYVCESNLVDNDLLVRSTEDTLSLNNYLFYKLNECWAVGTRWSGSRMVA